VHARIIGFARLVEQGRRCPTPAACPCCGACLAAFSVLPGIAEPGLCAVCTARARHRWNCFTLGVEPPRALLGSAPVVLYFRPHRQHSEALAQFLPHVRFRRVDSSFTTVQAIPLQRSAVDGVILLDVMEHVRNLTQAASELRRVIRPGGFLEHDTPCYYRNDPEAPAFADDANVVECGKGSRTDRICRQQEHLFAYRCEHLRHVFWGAGFRCRTTLANLTRSDYTRFLSIGSPKADRSLYAKHALRGHFRCIK